MDDPYIIAGEKDERRYLTFHAQLNRIGDDRFAAALSKEPLDVIAAVRWFIDFRCVRTECPRTRALLKSAPRVHFVAARITEVDAKRQ